MSRTRCLILLLVCLSALATAKAQDVVLVANEYVQISRITDADLRAIFTGKKTRFADGSHAVPVILMGGATHEVFLKNHLGEGPDEFRAQWRKLIFTGQGSMPRAFDSETALLEYVAVTPGAVGYVSRFPPQGGVKSLTAGK